MHVIQLVGDWYIFIIPSVISAFTSTDQEDRRTSRVKCIKDSVWLSFMLNSQFSHMAMLRPLNTGTVWETQKRTFNFQ